MSKISIRFFNDSEVRAVWADDKWWYSAIDIIASLNASDNPRNYWKVNKSRLSKSNPQLVTSCNRFKLLAEDGKHRLTDCFPQDKITDFVKAIPTKNSMEFLDWFLYSDNTIDGRSKKKAYTFLESNLIGNTEVGTIKSLQKIHAYIFGGLYDFAGQIRTKNISKGGFTFAPCQHFHITLPTIERMSETSFDEIVDKYVEMNVAHPFMEGNGRSTRIWLDLIFKKRLKKCVDWSKIGKKEYLEAMSISPDDSSKIRELLRKAMTDKINDRELFMKGIDYSYYYEEPDGDDL